MTWAKSFTTTLQLTRGIMKNRANLTNSSSGCLVSLFIKYFIFPTYPKRAIFNGQLLHATPAVALLPYLNSFLSHKRNILFAYLFSTFTFIFRVQWGAVNSGYFILKLTTYNFSESYPAQKGELAELEVGEKIEFCNII